MPKKKFTEFSEHEHIEDVVSFLDIILSDMLTKAKQDEEEEGEEETGLGETHDAPEEDCAPEEEDRITVPINATILSIIAGNLKTLDQEGATLSVDDMLKLEALRISLYGNH